jgi:hypothetical protein
MPVGLVHSETTKVSETFVVCLAIKLGQSYTETVYTRIGRNTDGKNSRNIRILPIRVYQKVPEQTRRQCQ